MSTHFMENGIYTFSPTDPLAELFEEYRQIEETQNHILVKNYKPTRYVIEEQCQLSIYVENNQPTMFSTIYRKDWWLPGTYRILNRTWKNPRTTEFNKLIYEGIYQTTFSQLEWCRKQPGYRSAFMTRENTDRILRAIGRGLEKRGYQTKVGRIWTCMGTWDKCNQFALMFDDYTVEQDWPYKRRRQSV